MTQNTLVAPDSLATLSLSELHERLKQRGVAIALSKLSEFVNLGDITEQLRVGGRGNRKEFLPDTEEILAEFLPKFRSLSGVAWEQAPNYLRSFLKGETSAMVASHAAHVSEFPETRKLTESILTFVPIVTLLERIAVAQERAATLQSDIVFDADGAAQFLCCSVRLLRRTVPASFRLGSSRDGDRWYKRDLLVLTGAPA